MKSLLIKPSKLHGAVNVPPSKSFSHRAIICASLCSSGESIIDNIILSEDIKATIDSMKQLGAQIDICINAHGNYRLKIKGIKNHAGNVTINCRESGSTLRFLIPLGLMLSEQCTFTGKGKLIERPLDIYYKIFDEQVIEYTNNSGKLPLSAKGRLKSGNYEISGSVSSQFVTGLLFALPLLNEKSIVRITDELESKGYIDITLNILKQFGIYIESKNYKEFYIQENNLYKSANLVIEGDYSQGAFFLVANELGSNLQCLGLKENSYQGDKEILNIINKYNNKNKEITVDASQIPDLVPVLTVLASLKEGFITKIFNAERVRLKESDRLKAISTEMNKMGADVLEVKDGLLIKGKKTLKGNVTVNSWNDHRIAMSLAIAATRCEKSIMLEDYPAVNKSYPGFWDVYKALGGIINELNVGQ